jgi:hypothetical protein
MPEAGQDRAAELQPASVEPRAPSPAHRPVDWFHTLNAQRALVLLVLAGAFAVQYRLVNLPIRELDQTNKFAPAVVSATDELALFSNPQTEPGRFSFAYDRPVESEKPRMFVNVYFEKASLADETLHQFTGLGVHPPSGPHRISYVPDTACNTAIRVETIGGSSTQPAVRFYQSEAAPSDRYRQLEVNMSGTDSLVTLSGGGSFQANRAGVCQVNLGADDWQQSTTGFLPIKVDVPAGSSLRIRWEDSAIHTADWPAAGLPKPLIEFGKANRQSFFADVIQVLPAGNSVISAPHSLVATGERKQEPLTVNAFQIGTDRLQFAATGRGQVVVDGKPLVRPDPLGWINKYPLLATIFLAANGGLCRWAWRRFFPRSKETPFA